VTALVDLSRRAEEPELLDLGVPEQDALLSLADLRFVNRWLGVTRSLLRALLPRLPETGPARLLDVGCGSGDLPAACAERTGRRLRAVGVDVKRLHLEQAPPGVIRVQADALHLPFASHSFDLVTASLFLHHFDGAQAVRVLQEMWRVTRGALVVNDLHRARVPWLFARVALPRLLRSPVSVADGLVSIRRAFTPRELEDTMREAGLSGVRVARHFPYRLVGLAER
jgi:ubiquinone/menaquinone biosynthesis C-methylase UbiE